MFKNYNLRSILPPYPMVPFTETGYFLHLSHCLLFNPPHIWMFVTFVALSENSTTSKTCLRILDSFLLFPTCQIKTNYLIFEMCIQEMSKVIKNLMKNIKSRIYENIIIKCSAETKSVIIVFSKKSN